MMLCSFNYSNQIANIKLKECITSTISSGVTNAVFVSDKLILLTSPAQLNLYDVN